MTVLCDRCGTTNLERSSVCAGCGLGLKATQSYIDGETPGAARLRPRRRCLTWKNGVLFIAVWALLVGEILLYGSRIPKTPEGWMALIFLGPVGYIALAGFLDWLFGSTSGKDKVQRDRRAA
jgi:hypothetical protein